MMQRPEPDPPPRSAPAAPPRLDSEPAMRQAEIDAMLSTLNAAAAPPVEEPPRAPDILELTESMATEEPSPPSDSFRTIDGQSDVVFDDRPYEPDPVPPLRHALFGGDALLSSATSSAVDSAFNTLAQTVLVQNARTLEDLVREMLRPMLKSWLDDNLPGMVERLVRAEIERVSRGRT
jgi:cell pole-organizing protein PopZ